MVAGFVSIVVGYMVALLTYFMCYYPVSTQIKANKSFNTIYVTYKMLMCNRSIMREESISNVADIYVLPIKSQYGIVGYVADITFKNGAKKIQLYKDRGDNVVQDFDDLSWFILGRKATNNEEQSSCDCSSGGCYCVCCKNWGLITMIIVLAVLIYIAVSFAIGYAVDEKFLD